MVDELHEAVRDLQVPVFLHGLFQPSQVVCDIAVFVGLVVMIVDVVRDEVGIAGVYGGRHGSISFINESIMSKSAG